MKDNRLFLLFYSGRLDYIEVFFYNWCTIRWVIALACLNPKYETSHGPKYSNENDDVF